MKENHIEKDGLEFQMLYGFRSELAEKKSQMKAIISLFMYLMAMIGLRIL